MAANQPIPFEIVKGSDGIQVASNGRVRVVVPHNDASIFRRRAIKGLQTKPPAEMLIPQLNQFAGELLSNLEMPAREVMAKLLAMAGMINIEEPQRLEWAVVDYKGVRVYTDGVSIVVTDQDLQL